MSPEETNQNVAAGPAQTTNTFTQYTIEVRSHNFKVYYGFWRTLYNQLMSYPTYRLKWDVFLDLGFIHGTPLQVCDVVNFGPYFFYVIDKVTNGHGPSCHLIMKCTEVFDTPPKAEVFKFEPLVLASRTFKEKSTR